MAPLRAMRWTNWGWTLTVVVCAASGCTGRGADDPTSAAARDVQVLESPRPGCKKIGRATGVGRGANELLAQAQASDGAKEQTIRMHGNALVYVDQRSDLEAGPGGTQPVISRIVDVYQCTPAPAASHS